MFLEVSGNMTYIPLHKATEQLKSYDVSFCAFECQDTGTPS